MQWPFGTPALPVLYHVHGAAFTAWMVLLILPPALVASGRTPLLLVYDRVTTGRFRRATLWGGALLVASQVVRVVLAFNQGWQDFARGLIN